MTQDVVGSRKAIVDNVLAFANWTSSREPGIYIVVVDRCNPDGSSRQRILDEIRHDYPRNFDAPIMWTQHCMLPLPDNVMETLTKRVMLRENHPSLGPDIGIITIAEIIRDHFLSVLEPPLDSIDLFIEEGPPGEYIRNLGEYNLPIRKNAIKKKKITKVYAGIVVFDEIMSPIVNAKSFGIWKKTLHCTLHYFGKNGIENLAKSDDPIDTRIYELCFTQKIQKVSGYILGFFMDEDLGVAGYMVQWNPLTDIGDDKIYHITTHLKNKNSNAFDSNKILTTGVCGESLIPLTTKNIGWPKNGVLFWFREKISLTKCYAGFATI